MDLISKAKLGSVGISYDYSKAPIAFKAPDSRLGKVYESPLALEQAKKRAEKRAEMEKKKAEEEEDMGQVMNRASEEARRVLQESIEKDKAKTIERVDLTPEQEELVKRGLGYAQNFKSNLGGKKREGRRYVAYPVRPLEPEEPKEEEPAPLPPPPPTPVPAPKPTPKAKTFREERLEALDKVVKVVTDWARTKETADALTKYYIESAETEEAKKKYSYSFLDVAEEIYEEKNLKKAVYKIAEQLKMSKEERQALEDDVVERLSKAMPRL